GRSFGDVPLNVELKLEVHDSPNSAGIVIDAVRCCKLALDTGMSGALDGPSSYFMKSPPHQVSDNVARQQVDDFIAETRATLRSQAIRSERMEPGAQEGNGRHTADLGETVVPPAGG
ncbi:MAG: hypothetical protein ACREQ5_33380, partial [Candidatus Dormibacteria bacterium]